MNSEPNSLVQRLEATGFFATYGLLGDGNFRPYDWEKMAGQLTGEFQALWRFFLLGDRLPTARLRGALGQVGFDSLKRLNVCRSANSEMSLGSLSLVSYRNRCFLVDRGATPKAYFGDDTKALMTLLPERSNGRCLCLYPNSSVAMLPLAGRSEVEMTYAIGPHDRDIVRANLVLNDAQAAPRFQARLGASDKAAYDIVVAACPSTFEPPGIRMPPAIAGGRDGRKHLKDLLSKAKWLLAEDGCLVATFLFFAEADSKTLRAKLSDLFESYGLGYRLLVCSKHLMQPGVPVFNMLFGLATAGKPSTAEATAKKMLKHVQTMKFEAAYLVKAKVFPPSASAPREILDFSDTYYGSWTF